MIILMMSEEIDGHSNKFMEWMKAFESKCLKVSLGKS